MKNILKRISERIEYYLPMSLGGFLAFFVVLYMFYIVGHSIWVNYNSNKDIENQTQQVSLLKEEIELLENQINYYQTASYKEKQAREKLAYKFPGERVISLPVDKKEERVADGGINEVEVKIPNYIHWRNYFLER